MIRRLLVAALLAAAAMPVLAAPSVAAVTACGFPSGEDNWEFLPTSGDWSVASNWDRGTVPGGASSGGNDEVCIPAGKTASLNDFQWVTLRRLVSPGTLNLNEAARLYVNGDSNHNSTANNINQTASTIAGHGKLTITGALHFTSAPTAAATQTTRKASTDPLGIPGRTVIAAGANMFIDGPFGAGCDDTTTGCPTCGGYLCGGVNVSDRRMIDNFGTTTISNAGFVAADKSTTFTNFRTASSTAHFVVTNNRGYFQGVGGAPTFVNGAVISKTGGTGTSIFDVQYLPSKNGYQGTVIVTSGTLQILSNSNSATVSPGSTFGNAGCADTSLPHCDPVATAGDEQVEAVTLPVVTGATAAAVNINEQTTTSMTHQVGKDVKIKTGGKATFAKPLRFTMRFDASAITEGGVASDYGVYRDGAVLPACPATGSGTGGKVSCQEPAHFEGDGDLTIVVRTKSGQESVFTIRKIYL